MNGIDLSQFQFDFDQTWAAVFLNADGTVYARYGSRSSKGPMAHNSVRGLVATMRRVLEAHAAYPGNRAAFSAKRGPKPAFEKPEDFPTLRNFRGRVSRNNCIHCHMVHEAMDAASGGRLARPYKYPFPGTVGLIMDAESGTRVSRVLGKSPAGAAGFKPGDEIQALGGQAILSLADIQFVLHHLPTKAALDAEVRREGKTVARRMALEGDWRRTDFSWRASLKGVSPTNGLYLYVLGASARKRLGIADGKVALEIRDVWSAPLRKKGLREGDVIVGYDGKDDAIGSPQFHDYVRVNHFRPGSTLRLRVRREGKDVEVALEF